VAVRPREGPPNLTSPNLTSPEVAGL
jgi:hypothetical protein